MFSPSLTYIMLKCVLLKKYIFRGRYSLRNVHNLFTSAAGIQITEMRKHSCSLEAIFAPIQPHNTLVQLLP